MAKKVSAYKKLKDKNSKLKQDIYVLTQLSKSDEPHDTLTYFAVKYQWDMRFKLENIVWGK